MLTKAVRSAVLGAAVCLNALFATPPAYADRVPAGTIIGTSATITFTAKDETLQAFAVSDSKDRSRTPSTIKVITFNS